MKFIKGGRLIQFTALFAAFLAVNVHAQSNPASFFEGLKTMEQAATSGTNWDFGIGGGHSLKGNNWLGYTDLAYNFSDNVGIVVGYDALKGSGQSLFNSVKGGVTLQTTIYPLRWTGVSWLENIPGTPSVSDLIATPHGGGSIGNLIVTGIHLDVHDFDGGKFSLNVGAQYENRSGQGVFDGNYGLLDIFIHRSF